MTMTTSETKKKTMLSSQLRGSMPTQILKKTLILMVSRRRSVVDAVAAVEDVAVVDEMNLAKQKNQANLRIPAQAVMLMMISAKSFSMRIRKISSAFPPAA
jgi:hypothetical protein